MEYLLDQNQIEAAASILGADWSQDALEKEIESLRATVYRIQLGQEDPHVDLDLISRRAYLLATVASSKENIYEPEVIGRALSVAATIFEYLSQTALEINQRLTYLLNTILFYSRGEQEAQSATVARRILHSGMLDSLDEESRRVWRKLLLFFGRDFKEFLVWGNESSDSFIVNLADITESAPFWAEILHGCLGIAKLLVWGKNLEPIHHFDLAIAHARRWGNTRLTWLGLTIKDVADSMASKSLRMRLSALGIPGWASETLTMDGFVEMWLPHRIALRQEGDLSDGILSNEAQISLINMPTSAGKSLIAEIAILNELAKDSTSKAIWVVPSRALVFEVQTRLSSHLRRIGISVSSLSGGLEAEQNDEELLRSARVFVLTPEKLDGLLRRSPTILEPVRIVIVDEMQKIGEGGRGWLLETVVSWLLLIAEQKQDMRIVFMSAVLPNRPDFEVWLGRRKNRFISKWMTWRPTRLALFVTSGTYGRRWRTKLMQRHGSDLIATHQELVNPPTYKVPLFLLQKIKELKPHAQGILVFFYTKDDVNNFVSQVAQIPLRYNPIPPMWQALSDKFAAVYGETHPFTDALKRGIGVDHGDIPLWLRRLVESAFKCGDLPTLVANQTVLEGVNFPIEDLIIGSLGSGMPPAFHFRLRLQDYVNLVGRVGRAMVDTEGRCFLVWNWFYKDAVDDNLSWESYNTPTPQLDNILSSIATNETELVGAIERLTSSLEGIDESAFDELGTWRDRLERLHSSALALLEQPATMRYERLSSWIRGSLAWQQLGEPGKQALDKYAISAWRSFQSANRSVYHLASVSGLSVRSAGDIETVARELIAEWTNGHDLTFESVFSRERFLFIINLRECWRRSPVTYGPKGYVPRIDHFAATVAWIRGDEWTEVSRVICANHGNLHPKTQAGIVAAYVSQMFEYRLPWVLGSLAAATRLLGGQEELCQFLDRLPSYTRYGVSINEAATISQTCGAERNIALTLAQKYLQEDSVQRELKTWLQNRSLIELSEWFPSEPKSFLLELLKRLHNLRERNWALRREGRVTVEIAGWQNYDWPETVAALESNARVIFTLRPEPENPYDRFAITLNAVWKDNSVKVGYLPAIFAEEIAELLSWGRSILVSLNTAPRLIPPRVTLELVEIS